MGAADGHVSEAKVAPSRGRWRLLGLFLHSQYGCCENDIHTEYMSDVYRISKVLAVESITKYYLRNVRSMFLLDSIEPKLSLT